ncbi:MAG: 4-phosphoerythronate dehydrogenase [Alloprevotella sp.]|nr:4-phosphoerythronate dehydrogenase [Alloprevotella sp.]
MKIVIDDRIPYLRGQAERLGDCVYLSGADISATDVRDADALIVRTRTRCDAALLQGSSVRFVATATIGFDHLDTAFLDDAGIAWTNCPGCNAASVAQYVGSSLYLLRRDGLISRDAVVGIVGVGHVGTKVAQVCRELGFRTLLNDPPRAAAEGGQAFCSLEYIAERAEVITFHVPLTANGPWPTHHFVDTSFLQSLAQRPVVINSSRGEVVATSALIEALDAGRVRAAVVDTWEDEPHISLPLLRRTYIATPHIAGYSADGKACGTQMALQAVALAFGKNLSFDIQAPAIASDYVYRLAGADDAPIAVQLYNPMVDSRALKATPERFEQLRGHYPLRREWL